MDISISLLKRLMSDALDDFFAREAESLVTTVNERNSCGRLAIYLQNLADRQGLGDYYADPEYNRKQNGQIKTILDDAMEVITINCDLILHSRGANIADDNLIAIEMKKRERPEQEKRADRNRLRALTKSSYDDIWSNDGTTHPEHVCGYLIGFFIELNNTGRSALIETFVNGEHVDSSARTF